MARKRRVAEAAPVQVYLAPEERRRLERLAKQLDSTKSDVLRRGIGALEREVTDPEAHPLLRLIGLGAGAETKPSDYDVAVEHDRARAEDEIASWGRPEDRRPER